MSNRPYIRDFSKPQADLDGKSILITGGTGSFGRAFVETIISRFNPRRVVIFSRDELKQTEMEYDLTNGVLSSRSDCLRFFIGDVRDAERLKMAMRGVDCVIHAAALKHVPVAEYNPFECIKTNVFGAENVVNAAIETNVRNVLALSTDKAASPINLYGASKLASDKIFVAANNLSGGTNTRFSVVRYGNVVGSRGSVVPLFRKLIDKKCESLPITDGRMTRFWITLHQGVDFVLSSLAMMNGGETFIPKIPSMSITSIASVMAPGLPQRTVGIRPGEKLHEVMVSLDDARNTVELDDRYIIEPAFKWWTKDNLRQAGAMPVSEEFIYSSDANTEWLDAEGLKEMLEQKA
ncbi:MAG TPA: UDP-N-acetylglucosamine 4,6-dehydratase (inverting) [Rhodospirillales bacterium]|nr:UDP-N-acetylglucosamine 4,6-dehydratase (inverting) [Rhodospirillales bacterium]